MDHVDWLEQDDIDALCAALRDQVKVVLPAFPGNFPES